MDINSIIEVDGADYLITQKVIYNKSNYYMLAGLNGDKINNTFGVVREYNKNGKTVVTTKLDKDEQLQVYKLLIQDLNSEIEKIDTSEFIAVGTPVDIEGEEFYLMDYIPMAGKIFMVCSTLEQPFKVVIVRRDKDKSGKIEFVDVTRTQQGLDVLRIYSMLNSEEE